VGPDAAPVPELLQLLTEIPTVRPWDSCGDVCDLLTRHPGVVSLPVVDDGVPVGLVNRYKLTESFSRRFFRELHGRKPISAFMETHPLVVDHLIHPDDLARIVADEGDRYLLDGFVVTCEGRYLGMGTGHALMRAISERRQAHLYFMAHHDVLTGLPNRQLLYDRLGQTLALGSRRGAPFAVLLADLDRFKWINDTFGHPAGDQVLVEAARRMKACVRSVDTVARLGGDEFTVVLAELQGPQDAARVARKLLDALSEPLMVEGHPVGVSCSIGIAVHPEDGTSVPELLKSADQALYHAKEQRGRYRYANEASDSLAGRRQSLEDEIRSGLAAGEFVVHYQPQVNIRSGRVVGAEALVRWQHPKRGLLPPGEFIELAEETGLILPLGDLVLRTAIVDAKRWNVASSAPVTVSVNLSPRQFRGVGLAASVLGLLEEIELSPELLAVEITESVAMRRDAVVFDNLATLRAQGVRVYMDDLGTGYCSLSYLKDFPLDCVKIERSFLTDLDGNRRAAAITRAIVTLAHNLELVVVAEGVERIEQLRVLEDQGCDRYQGYLCSPALPLDELLAKLPGPR
jgi:diguanylate cyclase (GGDEF)-like protein